MVGVVGDVAGFAVKGFAGSVRKGVPDGGLAAVFGDGAFNLVGGGGASPQEVGGESQGGGHLRQREFGKRSGGIGGCRSAGEGLGEAATGDGFHAARVTLPRGADELLGWVVFQIYAPRRLRPRFPSASLRAGSRLAGENAGLG